MKIYRNKSGWTLPELILFGLAQLIDGSIRVLSFGVLCTTLPLDVSRWATGNHFQRRKQQRGEMK